MQVKAETQVLRDVEVALQNVSYIASTSTQSRKTLQQRQELLFLLLENERSRLLVWLYPVDHEDRHALSPGPSKTLSEVCYRNWLYHITDLELTTAGGGFALHKVCLD